MASSSVSQEDHDVEHDFAMASRRAKVRSARANRAVNSYTTAAQPLRAEELERDVEDSNSRCESNTAAVLAEQNDASPKPSCRGISKEKRAAARGGYVPGGAGRNKGVRDRRKLREKRRSTGVMHVPSTESTGGSTGEDENNENSQFGAVSSKQAIIGLEFEEKVTISTKPGQSESDLDADDEANNSGDVRVEVVDEADPLKCENEKLLRLLEAKDKRISALEIQVAQLTRQMSEVREENAKLLRSLSPQQTSGKSSWKK